MWTAHPVVGDAPQVVEMRHRDRPSRAVRVSQKTNKMRCIKYLVGPESVSCRGVLAGKALCRRTVALGDPPLARRTSIGYDNGDGVATERARYAASPPPLPGAMRSMPPSASPGLAPGPAGILGLVRCTWFYKLPGRAAKSVEDRPRVTVRDGCQSHLAAALPHARRTAPLPGMCFAFPFSRGEDRPHPEGWRMKYV